MMPARYPCSEMFFDICPNMQYASARGSVTSFDQSSIVFTANICIYCKTLNVCGIKFSQFSDSDILAYFNMPVTIHHGD